MLEIEPQFIKTELEQITQTITEVLGDNQVLSIYLIGSAARNELSIYRDKLDFDIYSDYEFVVITKRSSNFPIRKLNDLIWKRHVASLGRSPLFKVDLGIFPQVKLRYIPASLWSFEFVNCGILMFGKEVRDRVGSITHQNIDKGNLRWLIPVRLWNYLKNEEPTVTNSISFNRLLIARNLLEVPSIVLPHFGVLSAGYYNRNSKLNDLQDDFVESLGGRSLFATALDVKLDPARGVDAQSLTIATLFSSFMALTAKLAKHDVNSSSAKMVTEIGRLSRSGFFRMTPAKELRMLFNNFRYCKHMFHENSWYGAIRCFFSPTRYYFFALVISIYEMRLSKCLNDRVEWENSAVKYYEAMTRKRLNISLCSSDDEKYRLIIAETRNFMRVWYEGNR